MSAALASGRVHLPASRVLNPDRPRLGDALAVVFDWPDRSCIHLASAVTTLPRATLDAREGWELLATRGVVPDAWASDPDRVFACGVVEECVACGGYGEGPNRGEDTEYCRECGGAGEFACSTCRECLGHAHPPNVAACVALASDPRGVETAEQLAREVVHRLAPWGVPQPARVVWRTGVNRHLWSTYGSSATPSAMRLAMMIAVPPLWDTRYEMTAAMEREYRERMAAPAPICDATRAAAYAAACGAIPTAGATAPGARSAARTRPRGSSARAR